MIRLGTKAFGRVLVLAGLWLVAMGSTVDVTSSASAAEGSLRAAPERAIHGEAPEDVADRQAKLHADLRAQVPGTTRARGLRVELTADERASIAKLAPSGPGPVRVGVVKDIAPAAGIAGGVGRTRRDGSFTWAFAVFSAGAGAIRVHLEDLSLAAGAALYVLGGEREAYGPFTDRGPDGDGDLWTPAVLSETATLVLTAPSRPQGNPFRITGVGHIGQDFVDKLEQHGEGICGNAVCILDASCHSDPAVDGAKAAVAQLEWISGPWIYTCTGGLLADTDPSSQIPYLLTANHCISRGREARSMEAFFFYRTTSCGDPCPSTGPPNNSGSPRTVGATVKATGARGDFTLLELKQAPPVGAVFLGWDRSPIAFSGGTDLYRISHPNFGAQVFSQHRVDATVPTCLGWSRGERIYSTDVLGATDGGSSGSPVVTSAGLVVGQLSGCCGTACSDVCNVAANSTVDGALAFYWDSVQPFLNPTPSCSASPEVCNDGVDNDCDGAIDCADSECSTAPGCVTCSLGQPGDSCLSNSDCCSGKCRGKPGNQTCR